MVPKLIQEQNPEDKGAELGLISKGHGGWSLRMAGNSGLWIPS